MLVLFTPEFPASFNRMSSADQALAKPIFKKMRAHLKAVPAPLGFQALPYTTELLSQNALFLSLTKQVPLAPEDKVFSITDGQFIVFFTVNLNTQHILAFWCISRKII